MHFYFSSSGLTSLRFLHNNKDKHKLLISYAYWDNSLIPYIMDLSQNYFILDSGAFSIWKTGGSVDIDDYIKTCNYLHKYLGDRLICINLDKIPSKFGVTPTQEDIDYACKTSYENYKYIQTKVKAKIMPVFHQHDNYEWLDKYIAEKPFLLGISPANDRGTAGRKPFLDQCFKKTKTIQRCHGLGVISSELCSKYPFYSVDAATWNTVAGYGLVLKYNKGQLLSYKYKDKDKVIKHNSPQIVDTESTINYNERVKMNIAEILKLEKYITDLWKFRNIVWED